MFKACPAITTLKEDKHMRNKGCMETKVPFLSWLLAHPAPEFWPRDGGAHSFSLRTRESLPTLLRNLNLSIVYPLVDSWGWEVKERKEKEKERSVELNLIAMKDLSSRRLKVLRLPAQKCIQIRYFL